MLPEAVYRAAPGTMQQDYPFTLDMEYRLTQGMASALFFVLFMLVFLPFGVSNYNPNHEYTAEFLLTMASFGVMVACVILASEFLLKPRIPGVTTTVGVFAWSAWTCLVAGTAIYLLYNIYGNWHDFSLRSALGFVANCATVLAFPLAGTFFYFRYRDLRTQFEAVLESPPAGADPERLITFGGPGSSDRIVLRLNDVIYGQAQDNYVELHYQKEGSERQHLLRATLTSLAKETEGTGIVRCHRSYVVNLRRVTSIRGSGSRLTLTLDGAGESIPVSRSYREQILSSLREMHGLASDVGT
jgi:hypothetical protein